MRFEDCFEENKGQTDADIENENKLKEFIERRMPTFSLKNSRKSYAATRYILTSTNEELLSKTATPALARVFDALFDITPPDRCKIDQYGAKLALDVPNKNREIFHYRDAIPAIEQVRKEEGIHAYVGETIEGTPALANITDSHVLIGGTTGAGKSVCVHNFMLSLLYAYPKETLEMILIDMKGTELCGYKGIPGVRGFTKKAEEALVFLESVKAEVDERNEKILETRARGLLSYNKKHPEDEKIPDLFVVVEEADKLFDNTDDPSLGARCRALAEEIAKTGRSAGIHLVIISQEPSANSIGVKLRDQIKTRISLKTQTATISRMILGKAGAQALTGKGDAILCNDEAYDRIQTAMINDDELISAQDWLAEHR